MFLIVSTFVVQAFAIPSASMVPTLREGDRIFVNKFIYRFTKPKRGDIAVFRVPDRIYDPEKPNYVKRIVGLPDDDLAIRAHPNLGYGRLYVNGELPPKGSKMREINYYYVPAVRQRYLNRTPLFLPDDVIDPDGLIIKIRDSEDPLSRYLRSSLSGQTLQYIALYEVDSGYRPRAFTALLGDLNRVLYEPDLYNEARFADTPATPEVRALARGRLAGRDLVAANRLLLDEAYPEELMRILDMRVPKGEVYCFGDNSADSYDSRSWKGVPETNLIGKAVFRFWPPSRFGPLD
jgi:signal peptidase I